MFKTGPRSLSYVALVASAVGLLFGVSVVGDTYAPTWHTWVALAGISTGAFIAMAMPTGGRGALTWPLRLCVVLFIVTAGLFALMGMMNVLMWWLFR